MVSAALDLSTFAEELLVPASRSGADAVSSMSGALPELPQSRFSRRSTARFDGRPSALPELRARGMPPCEASKWGSQRLRARARSRGSVLVPSVCAGRTRASRRAGAAAAARSRPRRAGAYLLKGLAGGTEASSCSPSWRTAPLSPRAEQRSLRRFRLSSRLLRGFAAERMLSSRASATDYRFPPPMRISAVVVSRRLGDALRSRPDSMGDPPQLLEGETASEYAPGAGGHASRSLISPAGADARERLDTRRPRPRCAACLRAAGDDRST